MRLISVLWLARRLTIYSQDLILFLHFGEILLDLGTLFRLLSVPPHFQLIVGHIVNASKLRVQFEKGSEEKSNCERSNDLKLMLNGLVGTKNGAVLTLEVAMELVRRKTARVNAILYVDTLKYVQLKFRKAKKNEAAYRSSHHYKDEQIRSKMSLSKIFVEIYR